MMPHRQRHTSTTTQGQKPYFNNTPRFPDMPQEFDASYMQFPAPELEHYVMTSTYGSSSLPRGYMPVGFDYYSGPSGTTSAPLSACGSTTVADISPPQSDDGSEMLSWNANEAYSGPYPQEISLSSVYETFPMEWPMHGPNTPPPEQEIKAVMAGPQEPTVCEHLGVSKLQAFSRSRRTSPRPIRPSSERSNSQDDAEDDSSPTKDDEDRPNARTDPLYETKADEDGYYHCPLRSEKKCRHDPTKQKCIFAKYLDSHLRPYVCKNPEKKKDCEELRFSSNACLFRHEREAHGMHNHGHNPYVCAFPDCERAKPGNGFPRRWNARDHMKRVHGYEPDTANARPRKGRKHQQKTGGTAMRRSTSGRSMPYSKDARPDVTAQHMQLMYPPVEYAMPLMLDTSDYMINPHATIYYVPEY